MYSEEKKNHTKGMIKSIIRLKHDDDTVKRISPNKRIIFRDVKQQVKSLITLLKKLKAQKRFGWILMNGYFFSAFFYALMLIVDEYSLITRQFFSLGKSQIAKWNYSCGGKREKKL